MSKNVQVTINNKMSSGNQPDKAFDVKLVAGTPLMTSGTILDQPAEPIASLTSGGGGLYSSPHGHLHSSPTTGVRGVVAYTLPGSQTNLVIYFDNSKGRVDNLDSHVSITTETVDIVAKNDNYEVHGSFVVAHDLYNYTAEVKSKISDDTLKCTVTITSSS